MKTQVKYQLMKKKTLFSANSFKQKIFEKKFTQKEKMKKSITNFKK